MKVTLEFPESEASYVLALLNERPSIQLRPEGAIEMALGDETEFLLRHPTNAKRLMAAMARSERGEYEIHDLDLDAA